MWRGVAGIIAGGIIVAVGLIVGIGGCYGPTLQYIKGPDVIRDFGHDEMVCEELATIEEANIVYTLHPGWSMGYSRPMRKVDIGIMDRCLLEHGWKHPE